MSSFPLGPLLAVALAGCGTHISSGGPTDAASDATPIATFDAAPDAPADAPPIPCVEGQARIETASGCFAAFTAVALTRVDARAACAAHGMHLAYVKSAADEATIATLANGTNVAIGLDDLAVEGTFVWEDGSPLVYTDWHTGEPNNGGGTYQEDCAIYAGARVGGQWDDRPCAPPPTGSGAYGYICQRAP